MKKLLLPALLFLCITGSNAQDKVIPLGLCLENYTYPFPVSYITLHCQQETLKMGYMDIRPDQPNGHTILLLHGKNFCGAYWGLTAKALLAKAHTGKDPRLSADHDTRCSPCAAYGSL